MTHNLRSGRHSHCIVKPCLTQLLHAAVAAAGGADTHTEAARHRSATQRLCAHAQLHAVGDGADAMLRPRELPDTRWGQVSPLPLFTLQEKGLINLCLGLLQGQHRSRQEIQWHEVN